MQIRREEYAKFLNSNEWKAQSKLIKDGKKCYICGRKNELQCHHIRYTDDLLNKNDIVVLCRPCHMCFHDTVDEIKNKYKECNLLFCHDVKKIFVNSALNFYKKSFITNTETRINLMKHTDFTDFREKLTYLLDELIEHKVFYNENLIFSYKEIGFEMDTHNALIKKWEQAIPKMREKGISDNEIKNRLMISYNSFRKIVDRMG